MISIRVRKRGDDEVLDRVDPEDLEGVELLADLAGPEVGGDRRPGDPGDHDRGHEGGELADRGQDEEAAEAVEGPEQGQEVGRLKARGAEPEGDRGDQHRKPAQLQGEDELGDELAAVGVGGPDRGRDRLAGEDHHVPHLLEQALGGQKCPIGDGSDHLLLRARTQPRATRVNVFHAAGRRHPQRSGRHVAPGRAPICAVKQVLCSSRLGGERHKAPEAATPGRGGSGRDRHRAGRVARLGGLRRRRGEPGRERALGQLPRQGHEGELPRPPATRQRRATSSWRSRTRATEDDPRPRGDNPHRRRIKAGVTATGTGQGSFNIRLDNPNLANPNRPVWVLENEYPKLLEPGRKRQGPPRPRPAPAPRPRRPTRSSSARWRRATARTSSGGYARSMAGTYPVHYEIAAGLQGKAKAVTPRGAR